MNWQPTQLEQRCESGESRPSYCGRVAHVVRMRGGIELSLLSTIVAAYKPTGFDGAARGSPG